MGTMRTKPIPIWVPVPRLEEQFLKLSLANKMRCLRHLDYIRQRDAFDRSVADGKTVEDHVTPKNAQVREAAMKKRHSRDDSPMHGTETTPSPLGRKPRRRLADPYMVEIYEWETTGLLKEIPVDDVELEVRECLRFGENWEDEERYYKKRRSGCCGDPNAVAPQIDTVQERRVAALLHQNQVGLRRAKLELEDELDVDLLNQQLILPFTRKELKQFVELFEFINAERTGSISEGEMRDWLHDKWPQVETSIMSDVWLELVDCDVFHHMRVVEFIVSYDLYCTLQEVTLVELCFFQLARWRNLHGEQVINALKLHEEFPDINKDKAIHGVDVNQPLKYVFMSVYKERRKILSNVEAPMINMSDFVKLHQSTQQALYPMFFLQQELRRQLFGDAYWKKRTLDVVDKLLEEGKSKRGTDKRQYTHKVLPRIPSADLAAFPQGDASGGIDRGGKPVVSYESFADLEKNEALTRHGKKNKKRTANVTAGASIDPEADKGKPVAGRGRSSGKGVAVAGGFENYGRVAPERESHQTEVDYDDHVVSTGRTSRSHHTPISHILKNKYRRDPVEAYFNDRKEYSRTKAYKPVSTHDWLVGTHHTRGNRDPSKYRQKDLSRQNKKPGSRRKRTTSAGSASSGDAEGASPLARPAIRIGADGRRIDEETKVDNTPAEQGTVAETLQAQAAARGRRRSSAAQQRDERRRASLAGDAAVAPDERRRRSVANARAKIPVGVRRSSAATPTAADAAKVAAAAAPGGRRRSAATASSAAAKVVAAAGRRRSAAE